MVSEVGPGGGSAATHKRSGWRRRRSSNHPPSTIPLRSTGFGINVLTLPVVFVIPPWVALGRFWTLRGMGDSTASRSVFCHI